jgi:hypothetical protein
VTRLTRAKIGGRSLGAAGPLVVVGMFCMLAAGCAPASTTGPPTASDSASPAPTPQAATSPAESPPVETPAETPVGPQTTSNLRATARGESQPCAETRRWGTGAEESAPYTSAELYNVRAGRHSCYDRVVFDVNSADPVGYSVRYVRTVAADGSGQPVPVAGGAALEVIVHAPDFAAASSGHQPWREPWRVGQALVGPTGWKALKEVRFAGSFEGQTTFAAGVRARLPFRVFTLERDGARRVVVDIAHRA